MTVESIGELALGPGAEFDVIRELLARWGPRATGIGDDAAIIRLPRGDVLLASVDSAVEGRHFRRDWLTPREIGYRAVAAALSDLAAMAARPAGVLVALAVPEAWRSELLELADGLGEAVDVARTRIVGGNVSGGTELSITTTVLGSAFAPLTRSGARKGDGVYVTGWLGGSGVELDALSKGSGHTPHRARFTHPMPRLAEAVWLAEGGATAAIDISDGLAADARHLASASNVRVALDATLIPRCDGVSTERALESGEEYELLVTATRELNTHAFEARFGIPLTWVGEIVDGVAGAVEICEAGRRRVASVLGYDHFSR